MRITQETYAPPTFKELTPGLRVDKLERLMLDGEGVIVRTYTKASPANADIGAAEGDLWSYDYVVIRLDGADEDHEVMFSLFKFGPLGGPPRFIVSPVQTPPEERQAEVTLDEVVPFLRFLECGETVRRPKNLRPWRVGEGLYFVEVCGVTWEVSDNGGELMVKRVNLDEYCERVYLTDGRLNLSPGTVAMRLAALFRGEDERHLLEMDAETEAVLAEELAGPKPQAEVEATTEVAIDVSATVIRQVPATEITGTLWKTSNAFGADYDATRRRIGEDIARELFGETGASWEVVAVAGLTEDTLMDHEPADLGDD